MKHFELIPGQLYNIRLTNRHWTVGEFQYIKQTNWLKSRTVSHFVFRNVETGRMIEIKARMRIRERAVGLKLVEVAV